jgi:hypothetical protein
MQRVAQLQQLKSEQSLWITDADELTVDIIEQEQTVPGFDPKSEVSMTEIWDESSAENATDADA